MGLCREHHDRGDGSRARQHRHRERRERSVFLDLALDQLGAALLGRSLGSEHVHRDEPENQTSGDAERRQCDAEELENERSADGERYEDECGSDAGTPRCRRPLCRGLGSRDDEIARNHGNGVDDEQHRGERDEREFGE